ncbi:3'-N-debenzoyl-2'-deoxytaxol N-benzoyltransferase [Triticum urartu]|uniref:3'-N-debenzoyl-2'-deoxytaxol N-benzoyltransferase n=1 Tax=Triticum urartu TaxID=4572 RepID=M7YIS9_TRIUA|nr:3'-N-debenzoyl-2'-deoxytaxol N-benzoyltransferase [Triticum urartu]
MGVGRQAEVTTAIFGRGGLETAGRFQMRRVQMGPAMGAQVSAASFASSSPAATSRCGGLSFLSSGFRFRFRFDFLRAAALAHYKKYVNFKTYAFPTLFPLIVAALNPNSNAYLSVAAWTHTKTYQHQRKWRIEKKINLEEKAERFNILMVASEKKITLEVKKTNLKKRKELVALDVTIPSSLIKRIKFECGGDCTAFEAVAAVLWRCRTRAVISDDDPNASVPLAFTSNVRGLVGSKEGYYGNCITFQQVQATSTTVASGEIKDLVRLIKLAKEKVPDTFQNVGDVGETRASGGRDQQQLAVAAPRYNVLGVSSWRNLGFEAVDFGRGSPARVMWKAHQTVGFVCVVCPPCKGEDGVSVLSLCVKPEHADAFMAELATLNI